MELFHIAPNKYLDKVQRFNAFCFAGSSALGKDPVYTEFIQREQSDGKPLVVHINGPMPGKARCKAELETALDFGAVEIIPPFQHLDGKGTLAGTKLLIECLEEVGTDVKIVAVAQGSSYPEYLECFEELFALQNHISAFGFTAPTLAKVGADFVGEERVYPNRLHILHKKMMRYIRMGSWSVYLLDLGECAAQELAEVTARFMGVGDLRAISSLAFQAGIEFRKLRDEGPDHKGAEAVFGPDWVLPVGTPKEKIDVALSSAKKTTEEMFIEAAEDNMLFLNEYAQAIGSTVRQ